MEKSSDVKRPDSYQKRVWIKASIYALFILTILLVNATFSVFLLVLAGCLVAVFIRGIQNFICKKTEWKEWVCLTISFLIIILAFAGLAWLIGAKLQDQINQLTETLPRTIENLRAQLSQNPVGKKIIENATSPNTLKKLQTLAGSLFKTTFGVFGDIYVIVFVGFFFTISPNQYLNGIVSLIPENGKKKGEDLIDKLGSNLKNWLKGKLFAMFIVFVLTAIALAIMGMPMWLVLAIIAGIFNFIPNFGPLIAMIPAVLVALMSGPGSAAIVAGIYLGIQVIESNFITPTIQQKLINIPPALIIIAQLIVAPLTGGWGLVLATPLMLIIMTLVQELYIKNKAEPNVISTGSS